MFFTVAVFKRKSTMPFDRQLPLLHTCQVRYLPFEINFYVNIYSHRKNNGFIEEKQSYRS